LGYSFQKLKDFVVSRYSRPLAWLGSLVHGRIWCRSNLLRKGILDAADSGCPICNSSRNSQPHFFECEFTRCFWGTLGVSNGVSFHATNALACALPPSIPLPPPTPSASSACGISGSIEMAWCSEGSLPHSPFCAKVAEMTLLSSVQGCHLITVVMLISG
jgi:hypothetical protein